MPRKKKVARYGICKVFGGFVCPALGIQRLLFKINDEDVPEPLTVSNCHNEIGSLG